MRSRRMVALLVWVLTSVMITGCAERGSLTVGSGDTRNWGHLTFASQAMVDSATVAAKGDDCETRIRKAVCLVEPIDFNKVSTAKRLCLSEGKSYEKPILELYAELPPQFQRMFCTLNVIYIEKELFSVAYGGVLYDQQERPIGNFMGMRQSVLDQPVSFEDVLSWKEQRLFGANQVPFTSSPALPRLSLEGPSLKNSALMYVLLHEMGHLFDYNNEITTGDHPKTSAWAAIKARGKVSNRLLEEFEEKICFYNCNGKHLEAADAEKFYSALERSDFITSYSMVTDLEDFAESTAVFFMEKYYGRQVVYSVDGAPAYNTSAKLESQQFRLKRTFLGSFYEGPIVYEKVW